MFSQASVHQSFCLGRIGTSYAPWDMSHGVVTPALGIRAHLGTYPPCPGHQTWAPAPPAADIW